MSLHSAAPFPATCLRDLLACTPSAQQLRSRSLAFSPRPSLAGAAARRTAFALQQLADAVRHLEAGEPSLASTEAIAILGRLERDVFRSSPAHHQA